LQNFAAGPQGAADPIRHGVQMFSSVKIGLRIGGVCGQRLRPFDRADVRAGLECSTSGNDQQFLRRVLLRLEHATAWDQSAAGRDLPQPE
jgi:hypothetical protein